jgi:hypothetical protein
LNYLIKEVNKLDKKQNKVEQQQPFWNRYFFFEKINNQTTQQKDKIKKDGSVTQYNQRAFQRLKA